VKTLLLVTPWYPSNEHDTKRTRAIADFVDGFRKLGVRTLVVVPRSDARKFSVSFYHGQKTMRAYFRLTARAISKGDGVLRFLVHWLLQEPFATMRFCLKTVKNLRSVTRIKRRLVPGRRFNAILVHGFILNGLRFLDMLGVRDPVTVCLHHSDYLRLSQTAEALKEYGDRIKAVAVRSHSLMNRFLADGVLPANKSCFVASSGIPRDRILSRDQYRYIEPGSTIRIVTISSLIPRKNIDLVISALAEMEFNNWEYHIFGRGPMEESLRRLAQELGVEGKVLFKGYVDNEILVPRLSRYDIFVLISVHETFGLVYLEALSQGLFVIATAGEGIDGIISHGKNGFLLSPGEYERLPSVIQGILGLCPQEQARFKDNIYRMIVDLSAEHRAALYKDFVFSE
jgi:glycosyltransferase involved in cell wall biosynthesis